MQEYTVSTQRSGADEPENDLWLHCLYSQIRVYSSFGCFMPVPDCPISEPVRVCGLHMQQCRVPGPKRAEQASTEA